MLVVASYISSSSLDDIKRPHQVSDLYCPVLCVLLGIEPRSAVYCLSHSYNPFWVFAVLGFEIKAYTLSYSINPFFLWWFFKLGSLELFAQAGFKP
jgi:hypothetical protein